ncbi:MAG: bifunctional shikimate kinase/3-dehydroquinate synthase [Chloroflexota bacterium]
MDVILVGLPGSGKSAVGRRLAQRHDATYIDLDDTIEKSAGMTVPEIFAAEGEDGFRARERAAVADLGEPDADPDVRRVVATGGGAVVDPRNRWQLYRGRVPVWLDGRPEVLAQRLRRSPTVRPLITGRDPIGAVRSLAAGRERFYAAAARVNGVAEVTSVVDAVDAVARDAASARRATVLLRADTKIGQLVIGEGIVATEVAAALRSLDARRAILVSEPGAWSAAGESLAEGLASDGWKVAHVLLPRGEDAKRLSAVEAAARELAKLRVERREPLVVVGGGALGDAGGFLAATWLRGVPFVQVPTTLVAQVDSSIGGKTAVDLPEGKNLVGAFHQPAAIVSDIALLRSLPERELRAALGEVVKMAVLGDERLFAALERDGAAIAHGSADAFESGAVAEIVERAAWAKVEIVMADERETAGRAALNLGHSLGHAFEAAGGFRELLHGEAVAYGLRAAVRIATELDRLPADRAERVERLLTDLGLALEPLPYPLATVRDALGADKKHSEGILRWVLPTAAGVVVDAQVPGDVVDRVAAGLLVGAGVAA